MIHIFFLLFKELGEKQRRLIDKHKIIGFIQVPYFPSKRLKGLTDFNTSQILVAIKNRKHVSKT